MNVCYYITCRFHSESALCSLPECQETPCSKQALYLKFRWQQQNSNLQPLSSQTLNHLAKLALIQFMGHGSGRKYGNSTNDPIFSSTFYTLIACEIIFEFEKNSKFMSCLWSILACKVPQFLARSYQFGQLIILFQKVDTMRLLKIYIIFCPPITAKYSFF